MERGRVTRARGKCQGISNHRRGAKKVLFSMASPSGKALYLLSSGTEQTPEDDALCLLSLGQNPKQEIRCYQAQGSLHRYKMRSVLPGLQEQANPKASSLGSGSHEEPPWAARCFWTGWSLRETEGRSPPQDECNETARPANSTHLRKTHSCTGC